MRTTLLDRSIVSSAEGALDFIGNILESSTEYSIIGKDLDGTILLWNEGARRIDTGLGIPWGPVPTFHKFLAHEPKSGKRGRVGVEPETGR